LFHFDCQYFFLFHILVLENLDDDEEEAIPDDVEEDDDEDNPNKIMPIPKGSAFFLWRQENRYRTRVFEHGQDEH